MADVSGWWQALTCQAGFDGWLTWHWTQIRDTPVDDALAPVSHPDPCVRPRVRRENVGWAKPVRASATEARVYRPQNLTDGNLETWWSAAAGAPQWFEVDLGEPVTLGTFRLRIGIVTPVGPVDIRVLGRGPGTGGRFRELHRFRTRIASGDVLEHTLRRPARGVRWVRFVVEEMADTWVIIHDVEIWRAR